VSLHSICTACEREIRRYFGCERNHDSGWPGDYAALLRRYRPVVSTRPGRLQAMTEEIRRWLAGALGAEPVVELFTAHHLSNVVGYRLSDGREVVAKARRGVERAVRCVAAQAALFADGFPCPKPLTEVTEVGGLAVHAEAFVDGEERLLGTDADTVDRFASVFADLQTRLERLDPEPPLERPMWLAWDHREPGVWPEQGVAYPNGHRVESPDWLTAIARRARQRMRTTNLPEVVGHADWETQQLRWRAGRLLVVHDWDSLSLCPEAALVGAAAATFPSDRQPVLAPIAASERFLRTYQVHRGRVFADEESEVAWRLGFVWRATTPEWNSSIGALHSCSRR
jgi:hypothetical protein